MKTNRRLSILLAVLALSGLAVGKASGAEITGQKKVWQTVTVTLTGPVRSEDVGANPFTDYRLTVTFTKGKKTYTVPGYFAADGRAGQTRKTRGAKWRAHFVPDEPGEWKYDVSLRTGKDIAISLDPKAGEPARGDALTGKFTVAPADPKAPGYLAKGMLRYVGGHYLQFAGSKEYYIKGGADSPENFLGYWEFDGTRSIGNRRKQGLTDGLHRYAPHVKHWRRGDPTWRGSKGKGIIGALNYLASKGVNSVYFLTYNIDGGDGQDTWMWTGPKERRRFDCSKLDQWEIVFDHMDRLGIQLHVVTQEAENDRRLDRGELGPVRKLYYRELVARFAHHRAVQWNLGEENNNTDKQRKAFARYIRALDPYDHPIVVHTKSGQASRFYNRLLGDASFEATSIQGDAATYNRWARELRTRSAKAGRKWAIYGDEQGPAVDSRLKNLDRLRKDALWGMLMGGGAGVEWYFGYQKNFGDLQSEDFTVAERLWEQTAHALKFFQKYLPFTEMTADNDYTSVTGDFCLAKKGEVYAVYLPDGGTTRLDLLAAKGELTVRWFNPRTGGKLQVGSVKTVTGGRLVAIGNPPAQADKDWVVLVRSAAEKPVFRFGVIADVQAADYETRGQRNYRAAYKSLAQAVADLNKQDLAFVIQLGDLVDTHEKLEGEDKTPLEKVLPIFNGLRAPKHHVIGNHDKFKHERGKLVKQLGMKAAYYDFARDGWRFIVLDGTDAGYGVLGPEQKVWLTRKLGEARKAGERVIVFNHFAVLMGKKGAMMTQAEPVLKRVEEAGVAAYFAGHHHRGAYVLRKGVHHVTFQGMVEAPVKNAYAVVEVYEDRIEIRGVGKVPSRTLKLPAMVKEISR